MIPDGIKLEEMEKFAKLLEKEGASAIHVSAGTVCSSHPGTGRVERTVKNLSQFYLF